MTAMPFKSFIFVTHTAPSQTTTNRQRNQLIRKFSDGEKEDQKHDVQNRTREENSQCLSPQNNIKSF